MKCVISANHVKLFAKTIHCLAKLGNEIYFDCLPEELEVKTVNASHSTFACFHFPCSFFERYKSLTPSDDDEQLLHYKISVKTLLQVFRSITFIERSVETCELELSDDQCQLVLTLNCRHAVVKTYRMNIEECERLKAVFSKEMCPNKLATSCKLLQDILINFAHNLEEISLVVSPCKVSLSSFSDENETSKVMSTVINLNPEEFEYFQIGVDTNITFCLKDLRAILNFAESSNSECKMNFEYGGKPFLFSLAQDGIYNANFVLATISDGTGPNSETVPDASESANMNITEQRDVFEKRHGTKRLKRNKNSENSDRTNNANLDEMAHRAISDEGVNSLQNAGNQDSEDAQLRIRDLFFSKDRYLSQINPKEILAPDSDGEG